MSAAYWIRGDTRQVLADMAAAGIVVDLAVTSPPFLNLRSYLPADDPAKALEIGSEESPGAFIDTLLDVTEGADRVLAPHGSIAVELGDTFSGSGGAGGDYAEGGLRDGQPAFTGSANARRERSEDESHRGVDARNRGNTSIGTATQMRQHPGSWPADKSLSLIPESYRWALAYGRNPFTGRPTPRWRVRNTVRWVRPNPPVGRDGDKFRPATSDVVIACRTDEAARRRYWDGDAVRVPLSEPDRTFTAKPLDHNPTHGAPSDRPFGQNPAGAPLLDWWKIAPSGYDGAHYATFPPKLVEPLVKTMCPKRVCLVCGEPSRRMVGEPSYEQARNGRTPAVLHMRDGDRVDDGVNQWNTKGKGDQSVTRVTETLGWTDCGHGGTWRPGIVLDPFAGSGTTLAVATGHGAIAIGIDLDGRNIDLARERVGPMFFHEVTVEQLAEALGQQALGGAA